jgi:tRNA(Ile)-lysidine synthase
MAKVRLVHLLMDDSGSELWSKHQINMLYQFINKDKTGKVYELHNGWILLHNRDVLIGEKISADIQKNTVELYPNIPLDYNEYRYELILNGKQDPSENNNTETINWSILKNRKLEIRTWKKGDLFQPLGMNGHQKISDFLINEKVDRLAKESQSVLTADGEIIWVCGRRISDRVKLTKSTVETAFLTRQPIHT